MCIDFHPEATQELADAAQWYLNRSPAAARNFAVEIERALDKIRAGRAIGVSEETPTPKHGTQCDECFGQPHRNALLASSSGTPAGAKIL